MEIKYTIKSVTLNEWDMYDIKKYYEAACTAEYIMENYGVVDENKAMELGYEVRRLMDKYGYEEEEAIKHVMEEENEAENC